MSFELYSYVFHAVMHLKDADEMDNSKDPDQTAPQGPTLMCLSIGTPKINKFSICPKWKIHYFQVSQNLGRAQPHYNVLEYWDS